MTNAEIRIEGMLKNIEKSQKTLERHMVQLDKKRQACINLGIDNPDTWDRYTKGRTDAQYWAKCEYDDKKSDIKSTEKKIAEFRERLQYWRDKKATEDKKNDVPVIPVIEDFLKSYREQLNIWYREQVEAFKTWDKEFKAKKEAAKQSLTEKYGDKRMYFWYRDKEILAEMESLQVDDKFYKKYVSSRWSGFVRVLAYEKKFDEMLNKELDDTVQSLRVDLFHRCAAAVGVITDASGLYIANNSCINGIVIGEEGKAKVETILAGGYNVQCLHYRVLVNKIRESENTVRASKKAVKVSDDKKVNYTEKSLQELIQMAKTMGVDFKVYPDERITRMRLVMALKKVQQA